jgi:UDP-galactopyranose mutase
MKNTYFVGRLATYKYYNMDQVVAQALTTFKKIVQGQEAGNIVNGKVVNGQTNSILQS